MSGSLRHRFPGVGPEWARFDGPAGTQMVDSAITAMSNWMASGNTAANGGPFAAAEECQRKRESGQQQRGRQHPAVAQPFLDFLSGDDDDGPHAAVSCVRRKCA